jgi:uncharacterized protein YhhL (DUF1145 family)
MVKGKTYSVQNFWNVARVSGASYGLWWLVLLQNILDPLKGEVNVMVLTLQCMIPQFILGISYNLRDYIKANDNESE